MRNLAQWLDEYSASHRHPTNKLLHWICVPLIAFSIICALIVIPLGHGNFNAATFVGVVTLLYYFRLSWRLALGMTVIFALAYWGVVALHTAMGLNLLCSVISTSISALQRCARSGSTCSDTRHRATTGVQSARTADP